MDSALELTRRDDLAPGLLLGTGVELGDDVQFGAYVVVHAGTRIGAGAVVGDHAVLGKQVRLAATSTASREPLPPLVIGAACTIGAHAVVNAGSLLGEGAFFSHLPRSASVHAGSLSRLWCLTPLRFRELSQRHPAVALELTVAMSAVLARRMYNRPKRVAVT